MNARIKAPNSIRGDVRFHRVHENGPQQPSLPRGWSPITPYQSNNILYEWAAIVGNLLLRKGEKYGIGGMYIEFENTASPGDPVTPPDFTRDPEEGVQYYDSLALSADRDYLRVPLVAGVLDSTDTLKYPNGNRTKFFAQTSGTVGVHGKTFSDVTNSTIFGGALVAFVDETDATRDLVFARFYIDTDLQVVKLATSQHGLEWAVSFE
jgi:hypothetical protein